MAVTIFGLTHVISGIDFADVQRDLGIAFLVGLGVLLAVGAGMRFAGSMALGFAVLVGFLERIHREPYTGTDVRAATAEAIRVLQSGQNIYGHVFQDTSPPGDPFGYPIGEPGFYWIHQIFFDRIDLADKLSGLLIVLLLAALAPIVGATRAALATMIYGTYSMAARFAVDGSNDTSFSFLVVLGLVLLVYSQSTSTRHRWRPILFILSAVFLGWAILFKQFAWFLYPYIMLALRQRQERWVFHAGIAIGGSFLIMLPFFIGEPVGTFRVLSRTAIDRDIWGLNIWSILKSFSPALAEPLTPFITLPSVILTLIVFVVQLPRVSGDVGGAVLRGLLVMGTLLITSVWTTYPYYTGASAILAVAIALYGAPGLATSLDEHPRTWDGLLPPRLIRTIRRSSDRLWGKAAGS